MTTTEKNKLIAEFMGLSKIVDNNGIVFKDSNTDEFKEIKYHTSWEWLMPVVNKCSKLADGMKDADWKPELWMFVTDDIESVYDIVINFIKWYNQQQK